MFNYLHDKTSSDKISNNLYTSYYYFEKYWYSDSFNKSSKLPKQNSPSA
jgi:hypothetical protein